ncbi:MAG: ribosomal protein S18-alanine N-acetyltransferase [Syntrophales bacterium]|nr:ribosomal protein S18-alanine N-acetyltransferase [Syntrophales bacterium]
MKKAVAEGGESIIYGIRDMTPDDMGEVLRIEGLSFSSPWTEGMFLEELSIPFCYNRVAFQDRRVIGYSCFAIVHDEVHLRSIAVDEGCRKRRVASGLLADMMRISLDEGVCLATLEARFSNGIALGLYERFGFKVSGVRPRYYSDTNEDASIMWADLREAGNIPVTRRR